eukprot:3953628-Ditylum_brightwellii.AAC.1
MQKTQETVRGAAPSPLSTACVCVQKEVEHDRNAASFSENSSTKERKAKQKGSPKKSTVYQAKHWACKEAGHINMQKTQEIVRSAAPSPLPTASVCVQKEGKDETPAGVHNQDKDKVKVRSRSTRSQVTKKTTER